jgi:hypothetical protein
MRHLAGDVRLFKILCTRCERTPVLHLTATWQTSHGVEYVGACPCGAYASVTTDGELSQWPTEEDNAAADAVAQASETASLDSVTRYVVTSQYRPEVRDDMYGIRDTETGEQMCSNIWDSETMIELAVKLNRVA